MSELVKRYSTVAACTTYRNPLDMVMSTGLDKGWSTQTCGKEKSIDSAPLSEISVNSRRVLEHEPTLSSLDTSYI